ncbi:DNA repair protein RadA (plasmid) [Aneurinibacillus sp. Ricciae_BoGa-3]|uniref:DNA repair protein RadA n=1 Tax=Aneurinibacillus sp. Ricciae_BoGa-3 TaxID=3022697 RepID=UPI00233FB3EB|nr:DNA repair protein RadA [Aneurinibacillus sp. Ricciae_BoGa-3]WCK57539.1 DNA repair protein RadA [Aneurinibacillus sp. Ricciae_BoGa-3]
MAKVKTQFKCNECGHIHAKWQGKCDDCGKWNTLEEVTAESSKSVASVMGSRKGLGNNKKPVRLKVVETGQNDRILTSNGELNRVLGGGIVRDSVIILSAPPGTGKSTLLLQTANELAEQGYTVLYCSGEESDTQIKTRADRTCKNNISDNLYVVSETSMNKIEQYIEEFDPAIVIIDSIQTVYLEDVPSRPGSPTQVNECTAKVIEMAKDSKKPRSFFCVGHMTKEDELAGSRTLEHAVDVVLYLEGDRTEQLRILKAVKNRFGDTGETGLFQMEEDGLIPIDNPSKFFITERMEPVAGTALTITKEGTRNIVVEVESLASKSFYGFPSRLATGIKKEILSILVEILEQRGGISCNDKNVTVMVSGGLKLTEPSVNLGVIMSIVSSVYNRAIPSDTVFVGEVGLTGEIKKVPNVEARIKEVDRMGFKRMYIPKGNMKSPVARKHVEVIEVPSLHETIKAIYGLIEKKPRKQA